MNTKLCMYHTGDFNIYVYLLKFIFITFKLICINNNNVYDNLRCTFHITWNPTRLRKIVRQNLDSRSRIKDLNLQEHII